MSGMTAIIYDTGAAVEIIDNFIPEYADGGAGFDRGTIKICYTGTAIPAGYTRGIPHGTFPNMYCLGPVSPEKARFGRTWATIGYKGFLGNKPDDMKTFSAQLTEQFYPVNGGQLIYWNGKFPDNRKVTKPNGTTYWRVRALREQGEVTVTGWEILTESAAVGQAGLNPPGLELFPGNFRKKDSAAKDSADPLITILDGAGQTSGLDVVALQSYETVSVERIGNIKLHSYRSTWKWYPTYSF